jgi:prepilin-type N-terminal cleavage/methylation domain-containing protein
MPTRRLSRGFTLVELMVVIGIMGMLVMLLVPVVASARMIAAKAATTNTIRQISGGLEAYKVDFGEYPPSRPSWRFTADVPPKLCGTMYRGAANLVWYLSGPSGNGWGVDAAGRMPYDGLVRNGTTQRYTGAVFTRATRSYGPYYKVTEDMAAYEPPNVTGESEPVMGAIKDAFGPPGKILYFRYEANPEVIGGVIQQNYQVGDNAYKKSEETGDNSGSQDKQGRKNFAKQEMLIDAVAIDTLLKDSKTGLTIYRYKRDSYVLISPGPDGVYGYVTTGMKGFEGISVPVSLLDAKNSAGTYTVNPLDDITNF